MDEFEVPPLPGIGTKARALHVGFQHLTVVQCCPADTGVRGTSKHVQTVVAGAKIDRAILESFALWRHAGFGGLRGIGRWGRRKTAGDDAEVDRTAARVSRSC